MSKPNKCIVCGDTFNKEPDLVDHLNDHLAARTTSSYETDLGHLVKGIPPYRAPKPKHEHGPYIVSEWRYGWVVDEDDVARMEHPNYKTATKARCSTCLEEVSL